MSHHDEGIPQTQYAVQLIGTGKLRLNREKETFTPGPHQILAKVEAVGICFSDLKLLNQFSAHPRKGEIVSGIGRDVLEQIASYVPGEQPTVPGHEVACRIVAVGEQVTRHQVGERCLVQTDYRTLPTDGSCAAFGYNFEGGLQEYVLMDERVVIDPPTGERMLISVGEGLSGSAVALVEPWACVEDSYANVERRTIKPDGHLLVVADGGHAVRGLEQALASAPAAPATLTAICAEEGQRTALQALGSAVSYAGSVDELAAESFDDIVYFGASKQTIDVLNDKLAPAGIINVVLGGQRIGAPVSVGVGRVHYGMTRWIGTTGDSAADGYRTIPETGEMRPGDRVVVVGAGGPMGQMHVIRAICAGIPGVTVVGADIDDARLEALRIKAAPLAAANGVPLRLVNTTKQSLDETFSYHAIMVPSGAFVASAVRDGGEGSLINIFAGIPVATRHELDLDTYIAHHCYMIGTSGSVIRDMKIVLQKVEQGQLDTNISVDAITGMAGVADALSAVEHHTLAGKIVVYPMVHEVGLIPLAELDRQFPTVAARLDSGRWCLAAEQELLRVCESEVAASPR